MYKGEAPTISENESSEGNRGPRHLFYDQSGTQNRCLVLGTQASVMSEQLSGKTVTMLSTGTASRSNVMRSTGGAASSMVTWSQ